MDLHPIHPRTLSRGFTLVEILLSLAITAMIGATVATMLFGVSVSTASGEITRDRVASRDVAAYRVNNLIRASGRVLASGADYLVLWNADSNSNQKPNLAEIRRVEFDPDGKQLRYYAAPASLADPDNAAWELAADFDSITRTLKGSANFAENKIMPDVQAFSVTVPTPLSSAKLINYSITLTDDKGNFTVQSAVAPHAQISSGD